VITFPNSLIESWWRVLKHQWLYLNTLDSVSTVNNLVAFHVGQHNTHRLHLEFEGQTPDEMYCGLNAGIHRQYRSVGSQPAGHA